MTQPTFHKYKIDYGWNHAQFWTREIDEAKVLEEFYEAASGCFGIRKSITKEPTISINYGPAELPLDMRGYNGTHALTFLSDRYLFDNTKKTPHGTWWRLLDAWGNWCSCKVRGEPEVSCEVHKYDVPGALDD